MILRAETCEVVSEWPLTADRDVWVEAKGLKEARCGSRRCSRHACWATRADLLVSFVALKCVLRLAVSLCEFSLECLVSSSLSQQGRYWVLIESDWDGAPCLLSHDDKGAQAVEVGVSCFHSQPGGKGAAATTVELLTPSHCHVDGHLLKARACELRSHVFCASRDSRIQSPFSRPKAIAAWCLTAAPGACLSFPRAALRPPPGVRRRAAGALRRVQPLLRRRSGRGEGHQGADPFRLMTHGRAVSAATHTVMRDCFLNAPQSELSVCVRCPQKHYADPTHADTFAWLYENRSGDLRLTETVRAARCTAHACC